jgi:sugar/nucleoside kinase (ribokinase family)
MRTLGDEPMALSADLLKAGVQLLNVTLGAKGVAYVHAPKDGAVRTALLAPPTVDVVDTTGCGDVFGATCAARLVAGDRVEQALTAANRAAARKATIRGATHLAPYLRGALVTA